MIVYYMIWWYIRCCTQYRHDIAPMNPCRRLHWYSVYSLLHHILINIRCVMGVVDLNHLLVPCVFLYCLQNIPLSIIHVYRIHVLFNILSINYLPLTDCIVSSIDSAVCAWCIVSANTTRRLRRPARISRSDCCNCCCSAFTVLFAFTSF